MALTDLPSDLPDGEYDLSIEHVHRAWDADGDLVTTAVAELSPRSAPGRSVEMPVPGTAVPDQPVAGALYGATVADGAIADVSHDWERSVRRQAPEVDEGELVLPLRQSEELVPGTLHSPALATVARNKSLLVTGEPGAGKTEAITLLLNQLRAADDTPMVVFSFKDDYTEWARGREDVVRLSTRDSTHVYNLFEEVDPDGRRGEEEFDEMANVFMQEQRDHTNNRYFPDAAGDLLGAILKYLYREGRASGLQPDNRELVDFVRRFSQHEVHELLDGDDGHEDLHGSVGHITPDAPKQSGGVYSTLRLVIERTFGTGDLSRPADDTSVSIREYMENPDGRVLLLDFPVDEGRSVRPAFRFFLHRAINFGLRDRGQAYYVLDEFARLPDVGNVETLVDTGRAQNAQAILGLQSVAQLDARYGDLVGDALRSGMLYELHLRSGDRRTVEYVRHRLGGDTRVTSYAHGDDQRRADGATSHPQGTALLQELEDGEGFLITPRGRARVSLPMYSQLAPETRRAIADREPQQSQATGRIARR